MNRAVSLAIEIASRASTAGLDATVDAAKTMRREVVDAAEGAASGMGRVSGAMDTMDDKAGRATGALGALSSGFELVGLEKYAAGLQAAAQATDFVSGVGQAMNLVLETEALTRARAAASTAAHSAATVASSAAAKAAAVAQWALNVALSANPIALVVIAVVALVAAFVIAYKKSETFRTVVQAALTPVKLYVEAVVTVVKTLAGWVSGGASAAWSVLRDAVSTTLAAIKEKFQPVLDVAQRIFDRIRNAIGDAISAAGDKIETFKSGASSAFEFLMTPINAVKDAIGWIVDKFASLKPPDWLNKLPGVNFRTGGFTAAGFTTTTTAAPPVTINLSVSVDPLTDPSTVAAAILAALNDYLARIGRQVVVV